MFSCWHLIELPVSLWNLEVIPGMEANVEVIPVLDVRGGVVVHGRQTPRERYPPVHEVSSVVDESDPLEVAGAFPSERVYVADLDAIEGTGDNFAVVEELSEARDVLLDPGVSSRGDLEEARELASHPVLGTETCPEDVMELCRGDEFLSLDVGGELPAVAERLERFDLAGVVILLLDRVGTGSGVDPGLVEEVSSRGHPVYVGGGVSSRGDLERLEGAGAAGALVSTALHDGSILLE